jgi:GT2 family glycosyltransferase
MVYALDAEPGLAAIGCRIVSYDSGTDDFSSWGYPKTLLRSSAHAFDVVTFVGAGHAIRRTAWEAAGGYDTALFFCWEEYDFCLRAIALGWQVRYRGDIVVRHKVSPDRKITWPGSRWFYHVRNRLYIARKQDAGWLSLAPRIAGYALKGLRNGRPLQTVRAIRAGMAMPLTLRAHALSPEARAYLRRNDSLHRGSAAARLGREVLAALPGHAMPSPLSAGHPAHPVQSGFPLALGQ